MPDYLHNKHFSIQEAEDARAVIAQLVEEIVELKRKLDQLGYDIYRHQYFGGTGPNGDRFFPLELEKLVLLAQKIAQNGILIKGLEDGLIDFPHIRSNGEEVYLCWKLGENNIRYWHSVPDGFAGRKPLSEL